MKASLFEYRRFEDLPSLLSAKAEAGDDGRIIAGGQSLVPLMNLRQVRPSQLFDINAIEALRGIEKPNGKIILGATTTFREILAWEPLTTLCPLLTMAIPHIGYPAVRNRGTIGGNLAFADPAAELGACVLALDVDLILTSKARQRTLRAVDFFQGASRTALAADEVLTSIQVPVVGPDARSAFSEISRRTMDAPICGVAITATVAGKRLSNLRIALAGISDRPVLANRTARWIEEAGDTQEPAELREAFAAEIDIRGDHRADATTRLHFASVLTARTLRQIQGHP